VNVADPIIVLLAPAVIVPVADQSATLRNPHEPAPVAVNACEIDAADADPDVPDVPTVGVDPLLSVTTITDRAESTPLPPATPVVTVTVIADDDVTGAVHTAACPSTVGAVERFFHCCSVYVRWTPRLSVIAGVLGVVPPTESPAHRTTSREFAGGVKLAVVTVVVVLKFGCVATAGVDASIARVTAGVPLPRRQCQGCRSY
jgi:hypothetical protein